MFYILHVGLKMLRKLRKKEGETNTTDPTDIVENIIITYPSMVYHEVLVQPRKKDRHNLDEFPLSSIFQ